MRRAALVVIVLAAIAAPSAQPGADHWVGTWSTAVVPSTVYPPVQGFRNPPPIASQGFQNQTVRQIIHTSIGGDRVRVVLSNVFGSTPLRIGAASIALRDTDSAIVAASNHPLTFGGLAAPTSLHLRLRRPRARPLRSRRGRAVWRDPRCRPGGHQRHWLGARESVAER